MHYRRALAVFDILGFRQFTQMNDLPVVIRDMMLVDDIHGNARWDYVTTLETRWAAAEVRTTDGDPDLEPYDSPDVIGDELINDGGEAILHPLEYCHSLRYADTVLLYADDDSCASLANVTIAGTRMIAQAATYGIPLRGAVTVGELHVGPDVRKPIHVGKGLVRAHDLEHRQAWIGGVIDPEVTADPQYQDAIREMMADGWLMRYPVPFKDGTMETIALVWPRPAVDPHGALESIAQRLLPIEEEGRRKQAAARAFLDEYVRTRRSGPVRLARYDDPRLREPVWDRAPQCADA